jgi:serum/glucocorticoid-regulated kinase 2
MKAKSKDLLNFRPTLRPNEDVLYLSCKVTKISRAGCRSLVSFVLTKNFICTFKDILHQRKVCYADLEMISTSTRSSEFVLHFVQGKHKRFASYDLRNEIILTIIEIICEFKRLNSGVRICEYSRISLDEIWYPKGVSERREEPNWKKMKSEIMSFEAFKLKVGLETTELEKIKQLTALLYSFEGRKASSGVCANDFELLARLGYESFGRMYLVQKKTCRGFFAMRVVYKRLLLAANQITAGEYQEEIEAVKTYSKLPMLLQLKYAFETDECLYYVWEYSKGQDLFTHLLLQHRFTEEQTRFYAANIALSLGFLHNKQTYCSNLRLKNVFMDDKGYLRLADFRLGSYKYKWQTPIDTLFLASDEDPPEHTVDEHKSRMGDWWFLGILVYKMLFGKTPAIEIISADLENDVKKELVIRFKDELAASEEAKDFITRLLRLEPGERLGSTGDSLAVLSHPWFSDLEIFSILENKIKAPFVPTIPDIETINLKFIKV